VLVAVIMAVMVYLFRDHVVDDSFITYRYARNLVRGLGVVWNPGEPPVEGYSNFLWMIANALGLKAGLEPLALSRVLGALSYAGSGFMVFRLGRALGVESRHAAIATILFSLVPSFPFWAMSGLETSSVVLFALLFFHGLAREWPAARWPWRTALWGVVLVLSRPDGLLIIAVALVALLWPPDRSRWQWLSRCMALMAPPVVVYQVWRQLTFGTPTPNTLSAKLQSMAGDVLVTDFLSLIFPLLLLLVLLARVRGLGPIERAILAVTAAAPGALGAARTGVERARPGAKSLGGPAGAGAGRPLRARAHQPPGLPGRARGHEPAPGPPGGRPGTGTHVLEH
jgi:hypothetical protein